MIKKIMLGILLIALPVLMSCDGASGDSSTSENDDAKAAAVAFDKVFRPSAAEVTTIFNNATGIETIEAVIKDQIVKFDNPVFNAVVDIALSSGSAESVTALLELIRKGILNPWTLLDETSLSGTHGCVTWSTGVDFDLQLTQSIEDFFNNDWWTVDVLTELEKCGDATGDFNVAISGSRLGVVYKVHVVGTLTLASMPGKSFDLDITYDLEDCLGKWDCVDWSGTVNGVAVGELE